ncbi:MAG: carbohydrate-binding domain-containing protein [Erysipelotrichaceae bacterium]|nr:carbohydrate-binding domain-containing protein [Erysipelotrichaceae bacterium]
MRRTKRFVAILLSLMMMFSLCCNATYAEDDSLIISDSNIEEEEIVDDEETQDEDLVVTTADDTDVIVSDETTSTNVITSVSNSGTTNTSASDEVQALIDALPTVEELELLSTDELNEVYANIQEANDAYEALSDDEQALVDDSKLDELFNYFNSLTTATDDEDTDNVLSLSSGPIVINTNGDYTISGSITLTDGQAAITVAEGVSAYITLNNVDITVQGETGVHRAGIYLMDGASVTLTLAGTNSITGKDLPTITKDSSTDVIGIWIGGAPSDSSTSNGGTSLTINGTVSLAINEVGTGISNTAKNSLTISGTTVTMDNIYMLDSTVSGMGIYNNGTLEIRDGATLKISNVNNDNLSGTYISYNNGYGIASQNEGGVKITGSSTTVSIYGAYKAGIYCSDKTDSDTDNYLTVDDGATLTIDGGSTSTDSQHAGIKMENIGTISVASGASIDISSTIYGIAVNANCLVEVEVDGNGSKINIHDLASHGSGQNGLTGIYAGENTIINVTNSGNISISGADRCGIAFEIGTSGEDGVFVYDGTLDISNSGNGIYVQGGTTSVEFTNGATVNIDVISNCIGSDGDNLPTGHILMSGCDTNVSFNTKGAAISCNFKYLKVEDSAIFDLHTTSECIGMGGSATGGTQIIITSKATFNLNSESGNGIVTYGNNHYIEVSDGATLNMSGEGGTGIVVKKDNTHIYVFDATLLVNNTNGIVVSSNDNFLYEDSLSHIKASNIYANNGTMDFIVMGGTLTYDFNHEDNIWPSNATDIEIDAIDSKA